MSALPTSSQPPKTTGPGTGTFSYFYLATVDVRLPYQSGNLTAKVRRIFEKRYTSAWNWAMLYNGDLELHPNSPLSLDGWVHSNGNAFIGNGATPPPSPTPDADGVIPSATPIPTPPQMITFADRLTFAGSYTAGYHPSDPRATTHTNVADAISPADLPPGSEQVYYPFGWNPSLFSTTDSNANNDGFREMIEKPESGNDVVQSTRLYNQAAIALELDASGNMKVYAAPSPGATKVLVTSSSGTSLGAAAYTAAGNAFKPGYALQDQREGVNVSVVNFDVAEFIKYFPNHNTRNWNGIIHLRDARGTATNKRAVRILNGSKVPSGGITIVSDNPVYVQGDFNTGRVAGSSEPPSNSTNTEDPDVSGYTRRPASVMADAITLLSNNWSDSNSYNATGLAARIASNTTVNAALVAGNVPTTNGAYSGGGENFVRFLEDWTGKRFTYYGAMMNLYASKQGIGTWSDLPQANIYKAPDLKWYFDKTLSVDSDGNPVSVPGYVSTVAYLQQQRWYLQF